MNQRLNTQAGVEAAKLAIAEHLNSHAEWFFTFDGGATQPLHRRELEIEVTHGRLFLTCWTEKGNSTVEDFLVGAGGREVAVPNNSPHRLCASSD